MFGGSQVPITKGGRPQSVGLTVWSPLPTFGAISGLSGAQERCRVGSFAEFSFSKETESLSYVSLTEVQHRRDRSFRLWIFFEGEHIKLEIHLIFLLTCKVLCYRAFV